MLLADLSQTSEAVASTRSRLTKVASVADLLRRLEADEIAVAIGLLLGRPRQGRLGVGWRGLADVEPPPATEPTLTLTAVDQALEAIAGNAGSGSQKRRAALLGDMLARATDSEQAFLRSVMLGQVRTGALEGVVTDAVAKASDRPLELVRRAAMLSGDLGETARVALTGSQDDLTGIGLEVGRAVLPMLAGTAASATDAISAIGEASVEYKLDGARIQVHRSGESVQIFTRTLADVTHRLPEIVDIVRGLPVETVVLDGETLALDENDAPRPFQDTMARFGADVAGEIALRPWFFDVLHVDGRDLIDEPLALRMAELERVAGPLRIPGEVTSDPEVAERIARDALAAGHEGVVVKGIDSAYAAGRRGASWVKVKPVHTFDLVVLAVERGSGRRSGMLSNIHLGAYDPQGDFGEPGGFVMVGKTFKGMTDATLAWQTEYFPTIATSSDAYTLHLQPTTVVEIAIDGVQRSSRYPGGIALRFARVKAYREDKRAQDADTIGTLRRILRA